MSLFSGLGFLKFPFPLFWLLGHILARCQTPRIIAHIIFFAVGQLEILWGFFFFRPTWEWVKRGCGDIMDAAIIYPFYCLRPGPSASPHSCFSLKKEQLGFPQMFDSKFLFCYLILSFLLTAKNDMTLFNLPVWRSGLDLHQSWKNRRFNPSRSPDFFLFLFFFF